MKLCIVSSSRADHTYLYWPIKKAIEDPFFETRVVVTGTHLSQAHGMTVKEFKKDAIALHAEIPIDLSDNSEMGVAHSLAQTIEGFSRYFTEHRPDLLLILGDRFEIFGVAQAAYLSQIPIAHLAGGDTSQGALDEGFRHSISKLALLHFPTSEVAAKRLIAMGEAPDRVFMIGSTGLDFIRALKLKTRSELARELQFDFRDFALLVTFHPETLSSHSPSEQFKILTNALTDIGGEYGIAITEPNADAHSSDIRKQISDFVAAHPGARSYESLGSHTYLSLMAHCDAVVGNSSSGLYEAPALKTPSVNIGNRQKGRVSAKSVIHAPCRKTAIVQAIRKAVNKDCSQVKSPFGDGKSTDRLLKILKKPRNYSQLIQKPFYQKGIK